MGEVKEPGIFRRYFLFPLIYTVLGTIVGGFVVELAKPYFVRPPAQTDADKLLGLTKESLSIIDRLTQSAQPVSGTDLQALRSVLANAEQTSVAVQAGVRDIRKLYLASKNFSLGADFYMPNPGGALLGSGDAVFGIAGASRS